MASAEAIDLAMVEGTNHPMGPLALADRIGLDTVLAICDVLHHRSRGSQVPPLSLAAAIREAGRLGRKERPRILYPMTNGRRECDLTLTFPSDYRRTVLMHERKSRFTSLSGLEIERVYTPEHFKGWTVEQDLGSLATFPYTRGDLPDHVPQPTLDHAPICRIRIRRRYQQRFNYLLQQGQTGLSVAFDLPTLMGLDSDDPRARGEVGYCGVAISSLADMERLFDDIPLDQVTTSMTINGPAAVILPCIWRSRKSAVFHSSSGRHHSERYPEGIHRAEGMALPAGHRTCKSSSIRSPIVRPCPEVASDQHQRLSHSGSRLDSGPGTGLYPV